MINIDYRKLRLPIILAAVLVHSATVLAAADDDTNGGDDSGFTLLSDGPNVTHWGLGAGLGYEESPYTGYGANFSPLPLVFFDDKWVHFFGNTLDLKVGRWDNVMFTLRAKYALGDGYKSSDAPILDGMEKRNGGIWFGPAVAWETGFGTLSSDFLTAGNKGQKADIGFEKTFDFGKFSLVPHVGAEWLNDKNIDYYYGVMPSEARAGRDQYTGKSAYNLSVGTRFDYHFTPHQSVSFDAGFTRLGSGITDSPLVGKTVVPEAKFGYLYRF